MERLVWEAKLESDWSRRLATSKSRETGIFVNSETTSKETNTSVGFSFLDVMNALNSIEFLT